MTRVSAITFLRPLLRPLFLPLLLLAAGTAQGADRTLDRTFTVSPGGSLVVNADGASVNVSSTDTDKVSVHMRVSSSERDLADMTLDATQKGNEITATMRRPKSGGWFNLGSWRAESSIEVTVPRRFEINVKTGGGSIELRDTAGPVKLNTSGGDITAKNLNGTVWLRTSGGGINVENVRGDVDANTSGGDVRLLDIDGSIKGHTSGGNVRVSLAGTNRGISATTSGGNIDVTLPRATSGNVSASTSGGSVKTDIPVTTTVIKEGRLEGTLNGGGQSIELRTSGGDIRLRAEG